MTTIVFSHPEYAQVTFSVMLATPEMASANKFEAASVTGSTDIVLSPSMYTHLARGADVRAYAIQLADTIVPLAVLVKREKLHALYCRLLNIQADSRTVLSWFGNGEEAKTAEELIEIASAH